MANIDSNSITRYSTGFKYIEKINATAPQPQRNVLKYFAIFKNVAHSLEPGETPSLSPGPKLCTTFLNLAKHDAIMSKNQCTGTVTQPQRNRKLCKNKDQVPVSLNFVK